MFLKELPATFTTSLALFTSAFAYAQSPTSQDNATYDYVGAQYLWQEWNDCEQDGLQVNGSMSIRDNFYASAAFGDVDGDFCGSTSTQVSLGYHTPLNQQFDVFASLGYINVDWGPGDDSGLIAQGGFRGYLSEQLESRIFVCHTTTDDGETALGAGISYWFNPRWAATTDASFDSDTHSLSVGAQYAF